MELNRKKVPRLDFNRGLVCISTGIPLKVVADAVDTSTHKVIHVLAYADPPNGGPLLVCDEFGRDIRNDELFVRNIAPRRFTTTQYYPLIKPHDAPSGRGYHSAKDAANHARSAVGTPRYDQERLLRVTTEHTNSEVMAVTVGLEYI